MLRRLPSFKVSHCETHESTVKHKLSQNAHEVRGRHRAQAACLMFDITISCMVKSANCILIEM